MCTFFAEFACHSYQPNILEMFLYLVDLLFWLLHYLQLYYVFSLVDEGTDESIKLQHIWKEHLSSSCVDRTFGKSSCLVHV